MSWGSAMITAPQHPRLKCTHANCLSGFEIGNELDLCCNAHVVWHTLWQFNWFHRVCFSWKTLWLGLSRGKLERSCNFEIVPHEPDSLVSPFSRFNHFNYLDDGNYDPGNRVFVPNGSSLITRWLAMNHDREKETHACWLRSIHPSIQTSTNNQESQRSISIRIITELKIIRGTRPTLLSMAAQWSFGDELLLSWHTPSIPLSWLLESMMQTCRRFSFSQLQPLFQHHFYHLQ